jgi:hypothetical protein
MLFLEYPNNNCFIIPTRIYHYISYVYCTHRGLKRREQNNVQWILLTIPIDIGYKQFFNPMFSMEDSILHPSHFLWK